MRRKKREKIFEVQGLLRRRFLCKLSLHSFIFPKKSEEKSCLLCVKTDADGRRGDLDDWKLETRVWLFF